MTKKYIYNSYKEAIKDLKDDSSIMIGGFGEAGSPVELIHSLIDNGSKNLTIIANNIVILGVSICAL